VNFFTAAYVRKEKISSWYIMFYSFKLDMHIYSVSLFEYRMTLYNARQRPAVERLYVELVE